MNNMENNNVNVNSTFDKLLCQTIKYNNSISIKSTTLEEVYYYTRTFNTTKLYKMCSVRLSIPFTGNTGGIGTRSRILFYLDDELICDGSIHNGVSYELKPLQLFGETFDLKPGEHIVKLMCSSGGGELFIPLYDKRCSEHTIKPEMSGKIVVLGFN